MEPRGFNKTLAAMRLLTDYNKPFQAVATGGVTKYTCWHNLSCRPFSFSLILKIDRNKDRNKNEKILLKT